MVIIYLNRIFFVFFILFFSILNASAADTYSTTLTSGEIATSTSVTVTNTGSITSTTQNVSALQSQASNATVINNGTLTYDAVGNCGAWCNALTIINGSYALPYDPVLNFVNGVTVTNNGFLYSTYRGYGIFALGTNINITNNNIIGSHTIYGDPSGNMFLPGYGIYLSGSNTSSQLSVITNSGTILAKSGIYSDSNYTNVINTSTGIINSSTDRSLDPNTGRIGIETDGTNSTINNAGSIQAGSVGISMNGANSSTTNSGSILAGTGGIASGGDNSIVTNSGSITSGAFGIASGGNGSSITNNVGGTVSAGQVGIVVGGDTNTATNSGAISVNGDSSAVTGSGNTITGITSFGNGNTITNNRTGVISVVDSAPNGGTDASAAGIDNANTNLTLINSGTISAFKGADAGARAWGVWNEGGYSIQTLTNTGTIIGSTYGIYNQGTITTLNNSQGAGNTHGALTYYGALPSNYNIIINSLTNYGQLAVTSGTNSMAFGIYAGSKVNANGKYINVLQGFADLTQITANTGTYNTYNYRLVADGTMLNAWDLCFGLCNVTTDGPAAADTQSSMQYQSSQLRSAFNTQTVAANFALNYDCNVFDIKGMCISAGGRYTTIDNPGINNSAAIVTLGYKVNPNIRIGAYLDQNINLSKPTGVNISNNTPLMGLYAVWNKEPSGLGYQLRLANTYQEKDVTSTRSIFGTSEAGSGTSSLNSQSYLAELSYAFQYQDRTLVRPYAGLRYTRLKQDGYTEATTDSVTDPLTVASLSDKSASALLGIKLNYQATDKAKLIGQLGLEQDLYHSVSNYSATSLNADELTRIAFNSDIKRTRPVASAGAYYDVTKTQRASATINYQQTAFQSTGSATAYFNYMIGF